MSSLRDYAILAVFAVGGLLFDRRDTSRAAAERDDTASDVANVILVVSDGLRWQEVFRGADSLLLFGDARLVGGNGADVRGRYWRPTLAERRAALMPFVWGTMARDGMLAGNRDIGSGMRVTNGMNFSYPGYNEMLVGYPDARIDRNSYGPNPNVTVFEWLNRRGDFKGRVGALGAWSAFEDIFNRRRSRLDVHASRHEPLDASTHAAAMRMLRQDRPRALFVAYVETDDWAHKGRYDQTLNAAHAVDANLAALWGAIQSDRRYRGRTTLIFTADHGRGRTTRDWTDHGQDVDGADETWVALIGPGVERAGESRGRIMLTESQIAATVAGALGLDYQRAVPRAAPSMVQTAGAVRVARNSSR